ncbi:hypothetical protein [Promicromonospora sp. NPDC023805]|uniref:hypothetical protein n=1 Tax=Promicromonospora sp. NPDC023805 TaxID=3154696 RepID=UPI0033E80623
MTRRTRATTAVVGALVATLVAGSFAACTSVPASSPPEDTDTSSSESTSPESTSNTSTPSPTADPMQRSQEYGEQIAATLVDALDGAERAAPDDITAEIFETPDGPHASATSAWEWKGVFLLSSRSEVSAQEAVERIEDQLLADDEAGWTVSHTYETDDFAAHSYEIVPDGRATAEWWMELFVSMPEPPAEQRIRAFIYGPSIHGPDVEGSE